MNEPNIFDALRGEGIDADDPDVREAVRLTLDHVVDVRARAGDEVARLCMRAMSRALTYQLKHPDVRDMSGFEADFDEA